LKEPPYFILREANMKILLVVPPYRTTDVLTLGRYPMPYGPILVASALKAAGHEVLVKDFLCPAQKSKATTPPTFTGKSSQAYTHYGAPIAECLKWLRENAPKFDAVGLAACQCNIWETAQIIAREIKRLGLPLVAGGPFVTTATEEAFDKFGMDVAVCHEGEYVAEEAFRRAIDGETGLVINGHGKIKDSPLPNWNLLAVPLDRYPKCNGKQRAVLTVSRGCPWECDFCCVFTVMGRKHRRQNRARIKAELLNAYHEGATYICFLDDNLFISEKAMGVLLGVIEELDRDEPGFKKVRFYVEEGMEVRMAAKPGVLEQLAGGRWDNLVLGLETVNAARAMAAKKPYKEEEIKPAIENCKRTGVIKKMFYIIGFPEDTIKSVATDLVKFAGLGMTVQANNMKLYPGTAVTKAYLEAGRIRPGYDWRLSAFHTPDTGHLTYATIRKLKAVLNAISMIQECFGINPFADDMDTIRHRLETKRFYIEFDNKEAILTGNMYRTTPYRILAEVLCARHTGAAGAVAWTGKNSVLARAATKPKHEVQGAILAAMRGQALPKTGFLY